MRPLFLAISGLIVCLFFLYSPIISGTTVSPGVQVEELTWVRCGGPPGGLGYDVRMSPQNPDLMFVTDAFSGVFRSEDGGQTWLPSSEGITTRVGFSADGIPVFSLTIDSNNPSVIWAGTQNARGIFKSTDGGMSWTPKLNGIVENDGISFRGFSVQPGNSSVVYAAAEIASYEWAGEVRMGREFDLTRGVVYKTTDGGENWTAVWRGDNLARYIWIDPRDTNVLYVSTGIFDREAANSDPVAGTPGGVGVVKSTDGGISWSQINQGLRNLYVGTLFMHPEDPDTLLAGAGSIQYPEGAGVYLTQDGGQSWQSTLDGVGAQSVEFSTLDPGIAYAADAGAVYLSEDGGQTWEKMAGGPFGWGPPGVRAGFPIDLRVDPRNSSRLFTNNYGGGNFLSQDSGRIWVDASRGYTGAQVRSIATSPVASGDVFASSRSGFFASSDGGLQWEGWSYPPAADLEWQAVAVDPSDPEHILAASNWSGGVLETYDRGRHWRIVVLAPGENQSFNVIRFAPSNPSIIYAGTAAFFSAGGFDLSLPAAGVFVSDDSGRTWVQRNSSDLETAAVTEIAVHPSNELLVLVSTATDGLFKSEDAGVSWQELKTGLPSGQHLLSVAIDPHDTTTLFAGFQDGALFRSQDAGNSWSRSANGMNPLATISEIIPDATRPATLYAADKRSGVYISQDRGDSWQLIASGLANREVNALALSADGRHLYAATEGAGVFRLDLEGTPPEPTEHLTFLAQFGDGEGFTSDIVLTNPSPGLEISGEIQLFDNEGLPLDRIPAPAGPAGTPNGGTQFSVAPRGTLALSSPGTEELVAGSAMLSSSHRLGGVIRFEIPNIGIAGVGESVPYSRFIVPVRYLSGRLSTGLALQNPEVIPVDFTITLRSNQSTIVGSPLLQTLPPRGHMALFIEELFPNDIGDLFLGTAEVSAPEGLLSATAMELGMTPGLFTTLPVTPIFEESGEGPSVLYFAQFGNGSNLQADVVLVNPSPATAVSGRVALFDDDGLPWEIPLSESAPANDASDFRVPPLGSLTLSTSGSGATQAGSMRIETSAGKLGGVVRYRIEGIGIAGVGESRPNRGSIVPVRRTEAGINTGIAVHNPEPLPVSLFLTLYDREGQQVDNGQETIESLPANGHLARFIDELFPGADTNGFVGTLTIQAEVGAFVATALELGPSAGQFTTLPVIRYNGPLMAPPEGQATPPNKSGPPRGIALPPTGDPGLRGTVFGNGQPLQGARVRLQTSDQVTSSAPDGSFHLVMARSESAAVTASAEGYYIGVRENCFAGDQIEIHLEEHPKTDNPDYRWLNSLGSGESSGGGGCAQCHSGLGSNLPFPLPVDEWLLDAHSGSARNERFLTMYSGTDVFGNRSPDRRYGNDPEYGEFPLAPDPALPYYGPGFKLDYPNQAGNCAACHTPAAAVNDPYQTDPRHLTGVAAEGIPCDFCHKVWNVKLDPRTGRPFDDRPGVISFEFRRPARGQQFFAGPLDDVAPGQDVYSPLQNESQFCAPCHFGSFWGTLVYNSFGEWLDSPYSDPKTGETCQDCHMPHSGASFFALPEKGGLQRNPSSIFSHDMLGANDPDLLEQALTMETSTSVEAGRITLEVGLWNQNTGHHVPTGSPLRQVILVVRAQDSSGQTLTQIEGPTVPLWGGEGSPDGGFYAGLPGDIYSKVLREEWTGVTPAASYWNLTRLVSDNRISALERRSQRFQFLTEKALLAVIEVRLLFRRAPIDLMTQKSWSVPDIVMAEQRHVLKIGAGSTRYKQ